MNYRNNRHIVTSEQLNSILKLCELNDFKQAQDVIKEVFEEQEVYHAGLGNIKKESEVLKKMLKGVFE